MIEFLSTKKTRLWQSVVTPNDQYARLPLAQEDGTGENGATSERELVRVSSKERASVATLAPNQILNWSRTAATEDIFQALHGIDRLRPGLIDDFLATQRRPEAQSQVLPRGTQNSEVNAGNMVEANTNNGQIVGAAPAKDGEQATPVSPSSGPPIVQFSAFEYYCSEADPFISLEVFRIGNLSQRSEVQYVTVDGTACAGQSYKEARGILAFEPGENEKTLTVQLIDDDTWRTTVDFQLHLLSEGLVNAQLGRYLWQTRLIVQDNDTFPTNRFSAEITEATAKKVDMHNINLSSVPAIGLMIEYFKLMAQDKVVWTGTIKTIITDQLHNLFLIQKLFMNVYLVDHILKRSDSDMGMVARDLFLLLILTVLPFAGLHYLDYIKFTWRVRGITRKGVQTALIRKFLNYEGHIRGDLNHGSVIMAIVRDAVNITDFGYMNIFTLLMSLGNVFLMLLYQFVSAAIFGKPLNWFVIVPMCFYPLALSSWVVLRKETTTTALMDMTKRQDNFVSKVDTIVQHYPLICEYNARGWFIKRYEDSLAAFNKQAIATGQTLLNNARFAGWLGMMAVGLYTLVGGMQVVSGRLTLGSFMANVHAFASVGASWGHIYAIVLQMQSCIPNLERVTILMNLPLDIPQRMNLSNYRIRTTRTLRFEAAKRSDGTAWPIDLVPIRIGLGLLRTGGMHFLDISQDQLVYILGPHGEGKSLLLRLAGLVTVPTKTTMESAVFVPSHLRSLFIPSEPMFFEGTLKENLTMGLEANDPDNDMTRISEICRRLGLSRDIRSLLDSESVFTWDLKLSYTQRQLLSLARAFISNPEFICLSKPMQTFNTFAKNKVLALLREFVTSKGICQDDSKWNSRRPRTCLVSTNHNLDPKLADQVVHVSLDGGVRCIKEADPTKKTPFLGSPSMKGEMAAITDTSMLPTQSSGAMLDPENYASGSPSKYFYFSSV
mmetsp:Transcript_104216/g.270057  ORF Transcript_104216/g.270057 Transcript_104216/m.270057 type:complete len:947 (-) Transcript_104216:65-2905(-)